MVRLEVEVLKELAEEWAHWEGEPMLQVVDEDDYLAAAGVRPDLVLGGDAHLDVLLDAEHPIFPERRHGLGGDDGPPPVTVAFVGGHVCLQLEVGPVEVCGGAA